MIENLDIPAKVTNNTCGCLQDVVFSDDAPHDCVRFVRVPDSGGGFHIVSAKFVQGVVLSHMDKAYSHVIYKPEKSLTDATSEDIALWAL